MPEDWRVHKASGPVCQGPNTLGALNRLQSKLGVTYNDDAAEMAQSKSLLATKMECYKLSLRARMGPLKVHTEREAHRARPNKQDCCNTAPGAIH